MFKLNKLSNSVKWNVGFEPYVEHKKRCIFSYMFKLQLIMQNKVLVRLKSEYLNRDQTNKLSPSFRVQRA